MPLRYRLEPFAARGTGQWVARAEPVGTLDEAALAERIARRSGLGPAAVEAVLAGLRRECEHALASGWRVQLRGLIELYPVVRGSFASPDAPWDARVHRLSVSARPARELADRVRAHTRLRRVAPHQPGPRLDRAWRLGPDGREQPPPTNARGPILAPGGVVRLSGKDLRTHGQPGEGLFVQTDPGRPEVPVTLLHLSAGTLLVQLPASLPAGPATLLLRKQPRRSQTLREARLPITLAPAAAAPDTPAAAPAPAESAKPSEPAPAAPPDAAPAPKPLAPQAPAAAPKAASRRKRSAAAA